MAAQIDQALADALGEPGVRNCLDLCGLTADAQKEGWIAEGMTDMEAILSIRPTEVYSIGKKLQKLPINRGGFETRNRQSPESESTCKMVARAEVPKVEPGLPRVHPR